MCNYFTRLTKKWALKILKQCGQNGINISILTIGPYLKNGHNKNVMVKTKLGRKPAGRRSCRKTSISPGFLNLLERIKKSLLFTTEWTQLHRFAMGEANSTKSEFCCVVCISKARSSSCANTLPITLHFKTIKYIKL